MEDKNKLLYEQIVDYLRTKILSNEFKIDEKLPTELELANKFGVSRITSKRALEELKQEGLIYRVRGSGSFVAPINHEKSKIDISSHPSKDHKIISIVIPLGKTDNDTIKASVDGMMHTIQGVSDVLNKNNYYLSIHSSHRDIKAEKEILSQLYQDQVSGIIYYPVSDRENLELLHKLYLEDFPIVTIDKYFENIPISYVVTDNDRGGYIATKYLIDLGHKRIAYVSDVTLESASSVRQRYFGYCRALKENNIPICNELVRVGLKDESTPPVYIRMLYEKIIQHFVKKNVTGIVTVNDMVASFLMRAALDLNLKVPEDLSIIGFDNIEISKHLQIPLTTISQDFYEMGSMAANLLIESIEKGNHGYSQLMLPAKLIIRNSCFQKNN